MKIGDIVIGPLGHEGPITKIEKTRITFQITEEKVTLDYSDYDVNGDPIVHTHLLMECEINDIKLK